MQLLNAIFFFFFSFYVSVIEMVPGLALISNTKLCSKYAGLSDNKRQKFDAIHVVSKVNMHIAYTIEHCMTQSA